MALHTLSKLFSKLYEIILGKRKTSKTMTWTELRTEIFIQAQNWRSALCTGTFSLASSSKGATSVDSVDLSFNYKTQTLDQLVDSN